MFKINVDIRRLAPLLGDKALEQEVVSIRVDAGDPEHIANGAVGGRSPALTQDAFRSGKADDGVYRQEVRRIFKFLDQPQFMDERPPHLVRQSFRIALGSALIGQLFQRLLGGEIGIELLLWILVGQLVKLEPASLHDLDAAGNSF